MCVVLCPHAVVEWNAVVGRYRAHYSLLEIMPDWKTNFIVTVEPWTILGLMILLLYKRGVMLDLVSTFTYMYIISVGENSCIRVHKSSTLRAHLPFAARTTSTCSLGP